MKKDMLLPAELKPRFEANDTILSYWEALRDADPDQAEVPRRAALDPRGIQSALPYAFVLERITPSIARVRIAGSKVNDAFGTDMRGVPVSALINPQKRSRFADTLRDVFQMPAIARINMAAERDKSQACIGQMVLLPLRDDNGEISRILGGFQLCQTQRRLRKRFTPIGALIRPASSFGQTDPMALRSRALQVVSNETKQRAKPQSATPKPALRLVVSNES